jgi:AcrR family transcriptional regulator
VKVSEPSSSERVRILEGLVAVVAERGYEEASMETVLARVGVDEATFRAHFSGKEECFLAAWQYLLDSYMPDVFAAFQSKDSWSEQVRAVGLTLMEYLTANPHHARVLTLEDRMPRERAWELLDHNIEVFTELIDLGRQEMDDPDSLTRATAEGLAGAVHEQLIARISRQGDPELPTLLGPLMYMVVRPYLGDEAARAELRRP